MECSSTLKQLDAYNGPVQWQTTYNLIALRQISFAMDKYWASKQTTGHEPVKGHQDVLKVQSLLVDSCFAVECAPQGRCFSVKCMRVLLTHAVSCDSLHQLLNDIVTKFSTIYLQLNAGSSEDATAS